MTNELRAAIEQAIEALMCGVGALERDRVGSVLRRALDDELGPIAAMSRPDRAALAAEQPQPCAGWPVCKRCIARGTKQCAAPPAPAEQPQPEPSARVAPARDSRCDYVTPAGKPCRKCGRVHDGGRRFKPYGI